MKPGDIQINIKQVQDEDLKINLQQENVLNINIDQHNVLDDISTTIHTGYLSGLDRVTHTAYFSGEGTEFFPLDLSEYTISWIDSKLTNNQGVENYGRPMVVGPDGNIIPGIFPDNAVWGKISGKLTDQKDLAEELAKIKNTANETINLLDSHITNVDNPHNVTKSQVGLSRVDNTSDLEKPISTATQAAIDRLDSKHKADDERLQSNINAVATDLGNHIDDKENPHSVTKAQVGLGNVDNTSDANKPISTATQEALDQITTDYQATDADLQDGIDANRESITSHTTNKSNPHSVTKAQVGLGNVDNTSDKAKPISDATKSAIDTLSETVADYKEELDNIDTNLQSQINTNKDNIAANKTSIDNHIANKSNPHSVTKAQVGLGNVDNTSDKAKPISDATQAALNLKADQATTYTKTEVDDLLEPKLDSSVAADTYATITNLNNHTSNVSNPHKVTKAQVGLGNVDNTSDANKPVSTATQEALDLLREELNNNVSDLETADENLQSQITNNLNSINTTNEELSSHTANKSNPHAVTKAQVGLGNVDNTSDVNKPISTATQEALDTIIENYEKADGELNSLITANKTSVDNHIANKSNPHNVTKAQVGLGNVDNTSDKAKPISDATQAAIDQVVEDYKAADSTINSSITTINETLESVGDTLDGHIANKSNPHSVTKAQVGLGNVDNTSDANKPVSTATQAALDLKANQATTYTKTESDANLTNALVDYVKNTDYATSSTAGVLKTSTPNGFDVSQNGVPICTSKALSTYNYATDNIFIGKGTLENIKNDLVKRAVTENDIELTDDEKTAARTWIGAGSQTDVTSIETDISTIESKIPSTASSTNLLADRDFVNSSINNLAAFYLTSNVAGDAFPTKAALLSGPYYFQGALRTPTLNDYAIVIADETKENSSTRYMYDGAQWDFQYEINDTPFTQDQVNAINSTATKDKIDSYSAHIANKSNPHGVTKAQVGLGNVDNTSDLDKPVSTATQEALDGISTDLGNHIDDKENPHSVTKAQVGLGNVDNTSDLSKPISTATQTALDLKANTADVYNKDSVYNKEEVDDLLEPKLDSSTASTTYATITNLNSHVNNKSNPHSVTKAQVGLGNVDNTSDANKPVSTAQQAALNLKADKSTTYSKTEVDDLLAPKLDSETAEDTYATITNLNAHTTNKSNPHSVTKAQVGLGNVDNTSDLNKPISTATQEVLDQVIEDYKAADELIKTSVSNNKTSVDNHIANKSNPHAVTKAQVGLGNVDNTSDANKPISTATQTALDLKANQATTYTKTEVDDKLDDKLNVSTASSTYATITNLNTHVNNKSNPHAVTKAQVGLGNVDNTSDLSKPISTATQTALDLKANQSTTYTKTEVDDLLEPKLDATTASSTYATITNLNAHTSSTSNPHKVTKAQVGLGNVDNTSDANKPISTATQAALNLKADQATTYTKTEVDDLLEPKLDSSTAATTYATITNLNNHINSKSNPHSVTKAQVGLGNVDNTSDLNKPISTATQTALDGKQAKGDYATNTTVTTGLNKKVDIAQGAENAGKALIIGDDGNVTIGGGAMPEVDNTTIIIKDDQLTANGVLDQNTSSAKFDWVGTLEEYNINNIAINHPDWICYIVDDVYGGDTVYTKAQVDKLLAEHTGGVNATYDATNNRITFA